MVVMMFKRKVKIQDIRNDRKQRMVIHWTVRDRKRFYWMISILVISFSILAFVII